MWWVAAAWAQTCDPSGLSTPGETVSVAWVSNVRDHVRANGWMWVVPTRDLRTFAADQGTGRTLQWLGMRRKDTDPRRRFKVVVFDAVPADLCRPIADEGTGDVADVARCDERRSDPPDRGQACGQRLDRATGKASVTAYRAQWAPLAANGFCVLPLERL